MNEPQKVVDCHFVVRTPAPEGGHTYAPIGIANRRGDSSLRTAHPPVIGDQLYLTDMYGKNTGMFRVVDRSWLYSSWGSVNWPHSERYPNEPDSMTVIVEKSEGLYADEALSEEES